MNSHVLIVYGTIINYFTILTSRASYQNYNIFVKKLCSVLYNWRDTRYKQQHLCILHSHNVLCTLGTICRCEPYTIHVEERG